MITLTICLISFLAAGITLFSGFGLGTVLMPVSAIFFPVPVAVAITAVVHFFNSLFKFALLWRTVDVRAVLSFGLPALLAAIPGALLLDYLSTLEPLARYRIGSNFYEVTPVKLVAGILLIIFATAELIPILNRLAKHHLALPIGGILSGFFGGLSGNQGAFRSAFLIRLNLSKDALVSTNAAIAALVDLSRIIIYGITFETALVTDEASLILLATISAFFGVFLATRLLRKVTINFIKNTVATLLYILGTLLCAGIL